MHNVVQARRYIEQGNKYKGLDCAPIVFQFNRLSEID